jgi:hypothetical protein
MVRRVQSARLEQVLHGRQGGREGEHCQHEQGDEYFGAGRPDIRIIDYVLTLLELLTELALVNLELLEVTKLQSHQF